ncbi:hypothetical protein GDO78_000120 [Eleutherodactylus coqui]|uniref:Uncharacterized protein n=1 Tax=Eleutherodactylus coqui TaxID=57060 RepID=A0A8J6KGL3_ELECQ|nr:hypothetical protein GDO78_000120 [Eleutherodactylus coqui]
MNTQRSGICRAEVGKYTKLRDFQILHGQKLYQQGRQCGWRSHDSSHNHSNTGCILELRLIVRGHPNKKK